MEAEYTLTRKIRELANLITKNRDAEIRALGLTTAQADTLLYFAEHPGLSIADLKQFLHTSHQTAQGIVRRMAEKGLLHLFPSQSDGRRRQVVLTQQAWSLCQAMHRNGAHAGGLLVRGMGPEERQQLLSLIDLGIQNFSRRSERGDSLHEA